MTERVSYYGLAELARAVHDEATVDELKQIIRDDRLAAICGADGFNQELRMLEIQERERIRTELRASVHLAAQREFSTLEQAAREMALSMAEATKAEHFVSLLADYKVEADVRARNDAEAYYSDRLAKLKVQWDLRVLGDERAFIREAALKLDLFPAPLPSASPSTPKHQRTIPLSKTASLAISKTPETSHQGDKRRASMELARTTPLPVPVSPRAITPPTPAAVPATPAPVPAPVLDPQTRGVASSMHNPANQMEDDLPPFETAFTQNANDGAAPPSQTPTPEHTPPPTDPFSLILHRIQALEDRFDQKLTAVSVEVN